MPLVLLILFLCTYTTSSIDALGSRGAFPPTMWLPVMSGMVLSCLAIALVWHVALVWDTQKSSMGSQRILPISFAVLSRIVAGLLVIYIYLQFPQHQTLDYHPIDLLLQESSVQAKAWADQAFVSKSIGDAVAQYRGRYGRYPPPRFDVWYEYAKERSSLVVDDFDDLHRDLEPFWDISPAEIRLRTGQMLSDPWNEVADIVIRKGKVEIGPKILATHRWMLEGIIAQIQPFAHHLPDMDLAFNINDEPRISIPYHRKGKAQAPKGESNLPIDQWSGNRNDDWPLVESPIRTFKDWSFNRNFHGFGSVACPPSSAARQNRIWDPTLLCISCAAPHSLDGFLSNWTLSGSPCHQPDLANLHGFYLSPAAFKPSYELYPVFSQSKAQGYSDILYPSAWNYIDKAKYEPSDGHPDLPFAEKKNTLFWRGATSEGVSRYGAWKGMVRQRLVHMTNNLTSNDRIPLLLPHRTKPGKYEHQYLSPSKLKHTDLTTDIAIVGPIARCWDSDCAHQEAEFGLVGKSDFQAHWQYRYLFDMDGAGFSGRFLPFLQSRSLPFKTALFREWYDSRLTAWKHFVPLDLRLHGVYSTLAYFAGLKTAKETVMQAKVKEAEKIAEEGREWAAKVLRKEDMEIYMFRLLLEWGRLTDDNRDEIGFSG